MKKHLYLGGAVLHREEDSRVSVLLGLLEASTPDKARDSHYLGYFGRHPKSEVEFVAYTYVPISNGVARLIHERYLEIMTKNKGKPPDSETFVFSDKKGAKNGEILIKNEEKSEGG